ncbi:MAG TPA: hypothetical protein VJY39_16675 [Acidisphaera sp.]|nr:hypothetical protein [Acidisphaera sp.]
MTKFAALGVPIDVIGRVLNHAPDGVTAKVYAKHDFLPQKGAALERWARFVTAERATSTSRR